MKTGTKTIVVLTAFLLMVLGSCGSSPSTSVNEGVRASGTSVATVDALDFAIREASDYLNDNVPKGSKIVILNIQSNSSDLSDYIIDELIANAVNDRTFSVVDRQQLDAIRDEQKFQLSGEVDDDEAMAIGRFLGAQTIVSGALSRLGSGYRIRIRALEVQTAQVQGQYNRNIASSSIINSLIESGGSPNNRITQTTPTIPTTPTTIVSSSTPTVKPNIFPLNTLNASNFFVESDADNQGGRSVARANISRETIDSSERDVINIEISLNRSPVIDYAWAELKISAINLVEILKRANGVRFKVYGDGKDWGLLVSTAETQSDNCNYQYVFKTTRNRVSIIEIPYSRLTQQEWGRQVFFNKNSILSISFFKSEGYDSSSIKIFDIETF